MKWAVFQTRKKADYKAKNKKAIDEHFVPAYERLISGLESLKGTGSNDKGLYYYPEGGNIMNIW